MDAEIAFGVQGHPSMLFPNWGSLKDGLPLCALAVPPKRESTLCLLCHITKQESRKGDSTAWPELKTRIYVFLTPRKGLILLYHRESMRLK